jgi:hypothetical protein
MLGAGAEPTMLSAIGADLWHFDLARSPASGLHGLQVLKGAKLLCVN